MDARLAAPIGYEILMLCLRVSGSVPSRREAARYCTRPRRLT